MRFVLAVFLPWLQFFIIERPVAGVMCLLLQISLIGWIPAVIWSVNAHGEFKAEQKIEEVFGKR